MQAWYARVLRVAVVAMVMALGGAERVHAQEPAKQQPPKPKTVFSQPWRPAPTDSLGARRIAPDSAVANGDVPDSASSAKKKGPSNIAAPPSAVKSGVAAATSIPVRRVIPTVVPPALVVMRPHPVLRIARADLSQVVAPRVTVAAAPGVVTTSNTAGAPNAPPAPTGATPPNATAPNTAAPNTAAPNTVAPNAKMSPNVTAVSNETNSPKATVATSATPVQESAAAPKSAAIAARAAPLPASPATRGAPAHVSAPAIASGTKSHGDSLRAARFLSAAAIRRAFAQSAPSTPSAPSAPSAQLATTSQPAAPKPVAPTPVPPTRTESSVAKPASQQRAASAAISATSTPNDSARTSRAAATTSAQPTTAPATATPAPSTPAPSTPSSTAAPAANASPQGTPGWAHITYISGATIYVDAGTKAGVREGTVMDVMRGNARIAELVIAFVSSTRASGTIRSSTTSVAVGDSAHYTPVQEVVAQNKPDSSSVSTVSRTTPKRHSSRSIRGRIGVRYLTMQMDGDASATLSQPALDARLDGHNIGGSPLGIMVDIRAYRQFLTRTGSLTSTPAQRFTRVYQTALVWNPVNSPTRLTLGRQFSTAISTIGLFDGLSMDYDRQRWSVGGFSGSQPDPTSFGYSGDVREHGAYVQLHNTPSQRTIWSLTAGGVGSYARGKIDREFAYFQAMATTRKFSLYATEELDINRGWKATAEGSSTTPTAVYATARYSITNDFSLDVGADSRRSVRLYRDFLNPEIAFDDSFRQGTWGGATYSAFQNRFRVSADARTSSGGSAGNANSYTGSLGVNRITALQLGTQLRYTTYDGTASNGSLSSVSVEMNPWGRFRLEANTGAREDRSVPVTTLPTDTTSGGTGVSGTGTTPTTTMVSRRTTWFGGDADVGIGRMWYLMLSVYRETGAGQRNTQGNVALSWRF